MMKKLVYAGKVLTVAALIVLTGCKKDKKEAFPTKPNEGGSSSEYSFGGVSLPSIADADGILAAVHAHNYKIITISPVEYETQYGVAMFTNTTGNFASLVDADSVRVNGVDCPKTSALLYFSDLNTYSLGFQNAVSWYVKGSSSVPAMTNTVAAGDPTYSLFSLGTTGSTTGYWKDEWLPKDTITITPITRKPTTNDTVYFHKVDSIAHLAAPPNNVPTHKDTVLILFIRTPSANSTDSARWVADSTMWKDAYSMWVSTKKQHILDSTYNVTNYSYIPFRITTSSGVTNYVTNTDTVVFMVHDDAGYSYTRKVPATDSTIAFKPKDFAGHANYATGKNLIMELNFVKYYPTVVIGSKKYYYIKMGSYVRYWRTN